LINQCRARARGTLGHKAFEAAYQRGKQVSFDAAVAYALGEHSAAQPALAGRVKHELLTRREQEVAELIARGMSNKQIADSMVIAQRTAESHIEHILTKLGFTSRTQIAAWIAAQQDTQDACSVR
jgi:non-specific serine/threonine protein kinase